MHFTDTLTGRPNTIKTTSSLFRNHIQGKIPPAGIGTTEAEAIANGWLSSGLAPRTVISLLGVLEKYVKWAGYQPPDTSSLKRKIARAQQETEVKALTRDEAERLLEASKIHAPTYYPMLLCALHTGMRRGELMGLRACDVDLKSATIMVRRSYDGPTKNGKTRKIKITDGLLKNLQFVSSLGPEDRVFPRFDPNPMIKRLCDIAGVKRISIHCLRHTLATLALESKASPRQVAQILGHSSTATTYKTYWSLLNDDMDMSFLGE